MNREPRTRKLRWCQLSLRDLLWLMVVCGILLVWWQDHGRLRTDLDGSTKDAAERRAEIAQLQADVVAIHDQLVEALSLGVRLRSVAWRSPIEWAIYPSENCLSGLVIATHKDEAIVKINLG